MWIGKLLHLLEQVDNARTRCGESIVEGAPHSMETHERIALDRDQRVALLLHVNQRLYQKGEISKDVHEAAKEKILLAK